MNSKTLNSFLKIPNFLPKASAFGERDREQPLKPIPGSLSFGKNQDESDSFHTQGATTTLNASVNPPGNDFNNNNNELNPASTSKPSTPNGAIPNGSIYDWGHGPDIPEDAFIPDEFQGFKNLLTLKANHHLTQDQISKLNTLLQEVKENQRPSEEVDFLFKKIMSRLKNMFGHKMSAEMRDSVFLLSGLDAKLLSPRQRQSMGQLVGAFILRHLGKQWDLKNYHHQGYLAKLRALGKPYGRETMVDTLINYPKIQVINGVQCVLSGKREGEPLKTVKMASYNLEHFSLTKFRNVYIPEAAMTEYASYASNGNSQKGMLNSILSLQGLSSGSKASDDDIEASIDAFLNDAQDDFHGTKNDANREANRLALKAIYDEHVQKVAQSVGKMNRLSAVISDGKAEGKMPDIIAFQEVRNLESVRALLNTSGLNEVYQNILFFPPKLGQDGLAIVTSNRVLPHNPNLVETRGTPRPSAEVTLDLGNNNHLVLYNVHFKADKWEYGRMSENLERLRLREAATIGQRIQVKRKLKQGNRFVVVGDFNADHTANMKAFKKSLGLNLVPMAPQVKTHVNGQLDKIYASDGVKVSSPEVVGSLKDNPPQPSDHLMMRFNVTI